MNTASAYDAWTFIKTLTFSKIWNGWVLRLSYAISKHFGKQIHWGKPEFLSIEPVNLCNLNCPECPTGNHQLMRQKEFLSKDSFTSIIHQSKKYLSFLQLYFQGEPFLHPKIFEFIDIAVQQGIYTATSTNGHYLSVDNCQRIIDSGLHRIIISLDGTTQEIYSRYRVGGSLEIVIQGIKNLVTLKKEQKKHLPFIILQFVVFKTNEHQIPEIHELAKKLTVDKLLLKSAQIEDFQYGNDLMASLPKFNRYELGKDNQYHLKRHPNFKCRRIWNGAVISASQEVLPCCFDKNGTYGIGCLTVDSLHKSFKHENITLLRQQVWGLSEHRPKICSNCTEGLHKTWF